MADTTNTNVTNANDLAGLLVNARQDAIFAGYENSLYLPGQLVNIYNVPAGSVTAQIPKYSAVASTDVSTELHSDTTNAISELDILNVASAGVNVTAKTYAARALQKDLGGMDMEGTATVLGRACSEAFDTDVMTLFKDSGITEVGSTGVDLTIDTIADAVQAVRANKFGGEVNVVLHPTQIKEILKEFTSAAFAGSDAANEAMRTGFVGKLFGANVYQSALVQTDNSGADYAGCAFVSGAFGIAMFRGLDVAMSRNEAGMGTDIIASIHANSGVLDTNRAIRIISDV